MLKKFVRMFGGDPNKREVDRLTEDVERINELEETFEKLSADEGKTWTISCRRLSQQCVKPASAPWECAITTYR
jgi:preprotein translocase subunit SecA